MLLYLICINSDTFFFSDDELDYDGSEGVADDIYEANIHEDINASNTSWQDEVFNMLADAEDYGEKFIRKGN